MPTYQYACTECGHNLEAVQSFSDDALSVCPECEGRLRKVFSAVGVVFKGSGFYRTDSRNVAHRRRHQGQVRVEVRDQVGVQDRDQDRVEAEVRAGQGVEHARRPPPRAARTRRPG